MKIKNEKYIKVLEELQLKMFKAEGWAEKMPLFEKRIIELKLNGEEVYQSYGERYKRIPLSWGINRGWTESGTGRNMTNNTKKHKGYFWIIYINCVNLFNGNNNYGLEELLKTIPVYYFDKLNTTLYVKDEEVERLLELLNDWYIKSIEKANEETLAEKKKKLERELEALNNV